ncbi:thioredoxin-like protein [Exophiala viscosa]|uniref:Thioredoxin-like protein n=1 Tax=Exophiala viscosa TaxID=2486360 RepID=A0AAN6IBA3_9EURO|nr:thioredoxin-like protein [Exophiala viscosa]
MADLAREEADRYFSHQDHHNSHPEDRDDDSLHSFDGDHKSSDDAYHSDPGTDDDDTAANMATMTSTRTTYHLPTQTYDANTGPKGVIADAQSYARAKQSTFRQRLASFAGNLTSSMKPAATSGTTGADKRKSFFGTSPKSTSSSDENLALSDEEADSEFMRSWRASRLAELSSQSQSQSASQRRQAPSQRTWGTFIEVDATGYLDAVEKVSEETVVVVMIYDPSSSASAEVEDELSTLAYKHNKTRFVRLNHEIADMESVQIPAVLAYRGGEVFATISDAKAEGLEGVLLQYVLSNPR